MLVVSMPTVSGRNLSRTPIPLLHSVRITEWCSFVGQDAHELATHSRKSPVLSSDFIMVQIVCAFLILNVFVGVVIDKYNEMKEEGDDMFETKEQRETARRFITAFELADNMDAVKVIAPPDNEIRKAFHWLSVNKNFDMVIMALIVMNTLLMAARHSNQGPTWDMVLDTGNTVFAIIFTIEMVIKMIGLGPTLDGYFYYSWNCFDCFLVVCSYLKFVPVFSSFGGLLTLFRILRVARIVRLVRSSDELKKIFRTLIIALPALGNVSMLLMLFLVIFAVLFMNIYSNVKHGENLGFYPNYENFGNSLMTMFRMSTGESFNGLMHDTMIKPPYCSPTEWFEEITINNTTARIRHDPNCGGPIIFTEIVSFRGSGGGGNNIGEKIKVKRVEKLTAIPRSSAPLRDVHAYQLHASEPDHCDYLGEVYGGWRAE